MTKLTLTDLGSIDTAVSTINSNNQAIENFSDKVVTRDGSSPNSMQADFDMNNHRIINLPEPVSNSEPFRKIDFDNRLGDFLDILTLPLDCGTFN
jgi:hypothetical protein